MLQITQMENLPDRADRPVSEPDQPFFQSAHSYRKVCSANSSRVKSLSEIPAAVAGNTDHGMTLPSTGPHAAVQDAIAAEQKAGK